MPSYHAHPNPTLDRVTQYGALALMIVMALAGFGQISLALSGLPVGLLLFTGIITLMLILPVIMLTTATPSITVATEGITVESVIWRWHSIKWDEIMAVKPYPLLPPSDVEIGRRAFVGRKRYQSAKGIMLVIPTLPLQYRVTGLFVGEGLTGVIALTNRTHLNYERLVELVEANKPTSGE